MAGRRTERRWPIAPNATASSTSTPFPSTAAKETRLTTANGLDDGPDYSPDGKYIYFNSERTGLMQIWRMKPDGSEQERRSRPTITTTGSRIRRRTGNGLCYLTYGKDVKGHPANQGRDAAAHVARGWKNSRAGKTLRRTGNDQRPVVVARQQAAWPSSATNWFIRDPIGAASRRAPHSNRKKCCVKFRGGLTCRRARIKGCRQRRPTIRRISLSPFRAFLPLMRRYDDNQDYAGGSQQRC